MIFDSLSPALAFFSAAGTRAFQGFRGPTASSSVSTVSASENRIDLVVDVLDIVVFKAAQHVDDGVHFVGCCPRNWLPRPSPFDAPLFQPCDIDEAKLRGDDLLAARDGGQLVQSGIGHAHVADVRLNRAERIVRRLRCLRFQSAR